MEVLVFGFILIVVIALIGAHISKNNSRERKQEARRPRKAAQPSRQEQPQKPTLHAEKPLPPHMQDLASRSLGTIRIRYCDSSGTSTERTVSVMEAIDWMGDHALEAICHLRCDFRTFLVSRIQHAWDPATGEVIDDVVGWAEAKWADTPEGQKHAALQDCRDEIVVMSYIARADGRMMKPELDLVIGHTKDALGDRAPDDGFLRDHFKAIRIGKMEFIEALGRLAQLPEPTRQRIAQTAQAIVDTQKTASPQEIEALDDIRQHLGR